MARKVVKITNYKILAVVFFNLVDERDDIDMILVIADDIFTYVKNDSRNSFTKQDVFEYAYDVYKTSYIKRVEFSPLYHENDVFILDDSVNE